MNHLAPKKTPLIDAFLETVDSFPGRMPVALRVLMLDLVMPRAASMIQVSDLKNPPRAVADSRVLRVAMRKLVEAGANEQFIVQGLAMVTVDALASTAAGDTEEDRVWVDFLKEKLGDFLSTDRITRVIESLHYE